MNHRRVQVLPDHLANKIAAGEVIQRPESVVKELLENSLDAGASNIAVIIRESGKKLIQVVDDGTGMNEEDAVLSFLRHATSKIVTVGDLEAITTYGFRGEALASVAAVAQVTMRTRQAVDEVATAVHIEGGGKPRISKEGREPGTSIAVQNLFYNVPARRRFLKSDTTEFRHIYESVQRVALSHPEIALKFVSDDETILDLRTATLEDRVIDLFGQRQFDGMVRAEEQSGEISLAGFIGKPTFGQKTRANQFLFLNKRYITNRNIAHAVYTAYENLLTKGTFPFFLLFIDIDPHRVDVNVHPSKLEVKFEDEQAIYRFVSNVVRRTLASNDLVPSMSARASEFDANAIGLQFTNRQHTPWPPGAERVDVSTGEILPRSTAPGTAPQASRGFDGWTRPDSPRPGGEKVVEALLVSDNEHNAVAESQTVHLNKGETGSLIWQLHSKYILTPIRSGLMIVDQHVAHERILYERALDRFENALAVSQQLLFPQTIVLSAGDYALVVELHPHFEKLGFAIKLFGKNTIVVEGIPPDVRHGAETKIIEDLLSLYKEYQQHGTMDARDNLAKSFSCKAAIKSGDPLTIEEMRFLVEQLFETRMPYVCPHGRPVVLKISIEELDRRFGRT